MATEKKILVPVNASMQTFHVLRFVLKNAPLFNWLVIVVLAFETDKEDVDFELEQLLSGIKSDFPSTKIRGEAIHGDLLEVLLDLNASEHFDLIVSGQYTNVLYYTTANLMEGLVEQCYTPILVLPESQNLLDLRRVGIMTSFHEDEIESIKLVEQLFNGSLFMTVFHVTNENEEDTAFKRMREWELDIRGNIEKNNIEFNVIKADSVLEGVKHIIAEKNLDVLVVTSIAKSFVQKLLSKNLFKELTKTQVMQPTLFVKCD